MTALLPCIIDDRLDRDVRHQVAFAHRDSHIQVNRELRVTEGLNIKRIRKVLKISLLGAVIAAAIGYVWFWGSPVGVNNYVNKVTVQMALRSPEITTQLGLIDNSLVDFHSHKLDSYTAQTDRELLTFLVDSRRGLDRYGPRGLEGKALLNWKVVAWLWDDWIRQQRLTYSSYRVNQISGPMVDLPQFLTDRHIIEDRSSLNNYIARLREFARVIGEVKVRVIDDRDHGLVPPDFIIQQALIGMRAFADGGAQNNPLITTLADKLDAIENLSESQKVQLSAEAESIVETQILPLYAEMIEVFEALLPLSNNHAGIWRLPRGAEIYQKALRSQNSTTLSAEEIHHLGLSEVGRIEGEMEQILVDNGLAEGPIVDRVRYLMTLPEHNFANTEAGRAAQIAYLNRVNDQLMAKVAEFFITIPSQPLEILRVPEYAEDAAPGGYYTPPAFDGSAPGRFYINQKNTADNPRWTLPTLMYHEGSPGHHFQLSASQLMEDVPFLLKLSPFNAYSEGWALYSERIAKTDMGMYKTNPLGDLGRLQAEIFRAVRLVVDTGIHAKRWSRERAIDYMLSKTGMTEAEVTREIERYVVWPGQATAYKVGQLALLKLRANAETQLGAAFDLRQFHEMILLNGAMPLEVLEESVDLWIQQQLAL